MLIVPHVSPPAAVLLLLLLPLQAYLADQVVPLFGNTHTTTSITGAQTTCFRHEARQIIAQAVNAKVWALRGGKVADMAPPCIGPRISTTVHRKQSIGACKDGVANHPIVKTCGLISILRLWSISSIGNRSTLCAVGSATCKWYSPSLGLGPAGGWARNECDNMLLKSHSKR